MIYIGCFLGAALFAQLATSFDIKKNRAIVLFFSLLSILTLSILGGCRATTLGTDVELYVVPHFEDARTFSRLIDFLTIFNTYTGKEPLYRTLVYFVSRFTENVNWLLFALQFFTVAFVYIGAYKHRNKISVPFVLLLWCLLFYNDSYNMVRQHLAMAIIFAGVYDVEKGNYKKYIVYVIIASLVHLSAALAIAILVIHYLVTSGKSWKEKIGKKAFWVIGIMIGCLFFEQIIVFIVNLGLLEERYLYYFNASVISSNNFQILLYGLEIIVILICSKKLKRVVEIPAFYVINAYTLFMVLQLSRVMYYGNRVSMYFGIVNILLIAHMPKIMNGAKQRLIASIFIISIIGLYWWYIYIYGGVSMTYPYIWGV